jgi:spermidine synthase
MLYFAPASAILGMVSPYLVKLAATDSNRLGRASGGVFAASTLGSIAGTFAGGFWLIPHLPISYILGGMVLLLLVLSLACSGGRPSWHISVMAVGLLGFMSVIAFGSAANSGRTIYEKNSEYYNIRVNDVSNGNVRLLLLDGSTNSARFVGLPGMPFPYVDMSSQMIRRLKPAPRSALALGGGGYSIPQYIKQYSPKTDVTVVEIDPEVTAVAKRLFLDDPAIPIVTLNEDARIFLNHNRQQFEIIYTDAYSGAFSIPPTLASQEAFRVMDRALGSDGVIVFNIVSALSGPCSRVYGSLMKTMRDVFPNPAVFATRPDQPAVPQNIIVLAAKRGHVLSEDVLQDFGPYRWRTVPSDGLMLTDDFAPTDYLASDLVRVIYPRLRPFQ